MKNLFRIMALVLLVSAVIWWLGAGANRGWTKTSVQVKQFDDVTGIEGITYQKRFVPGLDFLGSALLGAGVLAGASLFFRKKQNTRTKL
jgi:hypothetical protein